MASNTQLEISRQDFETLLRDLSGDKMQSNLAGVQCVSEAYSQLIAEPDVSVFFGETGRAKRPTQADQLPDKPDENTINESNNEEYDYLKPDNHGIPLHTSTPLHPKIPYANDLNKNPKPGSLLFKRPVKRFGKDRRAIPQAAHDNPAFDQENDPGPKKEIDNDTPGAEHPWKVPTSPALRSSRSRKDMKLIHEQEEQLKYYEQNASVLDDQRAELQTKLTVCQQQLKELQENDSRRLQHIEEIEHELENTQNELHKRRMKQNEELRKAREAAAALEERLARGEDIKTKPLPLDLDDTAKFDSPPRLGSPLLASTPAPPAKTIPADEWSDVSIRLEKLEEEKKSYQGVLDKMEKERSGYLTVISDLKHQLANLQTEIVSFKMSTEEQHLKLQQKVAQNEEDSIREDNMSLMMDMAPDSIFQKIIPMIAEQRQYIKELLDGTEGSANDTTQSIAVDSKPTLLPSTRSIVIGAVGLCILGALFSDMLNSSNSAAAPDVLWWQRYGSTIESWGATLDSWVRPKNQHIPS